MSERLIKRTHVYVQHPRTYEIAGCSVSPDHGVTWSEFEGRLWCFTCCVDFIPEHWGVFDGPIPVEAAKLIGLSFDRMNIETGEIIKMPDVKGEMPTLEACNATWNHE